MKKDGTFMINYPNGIKKTIIANKTCDGNKNRGMNFEAEINMSNEYYRREDRAFVYKKPTPIKVVKITNKKSLPGCISEAYFEQPSTTDYNGIYKGKYLDFEAKETLNKTSFPLANIHPHQIEHLININRHGGIGFIIVHFKKLNEIYILDVAVVKEYSLVRGSIPYDVFVNKGKKVKQGYLIRLDYLQAVDELYNL